MDPSAKLFAVISAALSLVACVPAQQTSNPAGEPADPVAALQTALDEQMQAAKILGNPELDKDAAAIRQAVQAAKPHVQTVRDNLMAARSGLNGIAQQMVQMALTELGSATQLGELIVGEADEQVPLRHGELQVHGAPR